MNLLTLACCNLRQMEYSQNVKADIGVIGLSTMGSNLARNIANKGFKVVVFNRTGKVTSEFLSKYKSDRLMGAKDLKSFVEKLAIPREVLILVKAGAPVDEVLDKLVPLLEPGDVIVDCGNSHYQDTIRRQENLVHRQIKYLGCGVSGGESGALQGPSLMVGGDQSAWQQLSTIFQAIAAKDFAINPCVTYLGENGAGHFTKMVHNGIEYAIMQLLAEAYQLLKVVYSLKPEEIAEQFSNFNQGELNSYLIDISIDILKKKDDLDPKGGYLIDMILDKAEQKGTGKWSVNDALERLVPVPSISEAVSARILSGFKERRERNSKLYENPEETLKIFFTEFSEYLEKALIVGELIIYAQGFDLLQKANKEQGWQIDLLELVRIWQGGCIIRAQLLKKFQEIFKEGDNKHIFLLELPELVTLVRQYLPGLRQVVQVGVSNAVYLPGFTASLEYFDGVTSSTLSASFVSALRDFFGAHTYERIDREGKFHTEWEQEPKIT